MIWVDCSSVDVEKISILELKANLVLLSSLLATAPDKEREDVVQELLQRVKGLLSRELQGPSNSSYT
jgi:hypothetical protein